MQQWVVELGAWVRNPAVDIHDQLRRYISVDALQVLHPDLHELFELSEGIGTGHKLIQVCIEFLAKLSCIPFALRIRRYHG